MTGSAEALDLAAGLSVEQLARIGTAMAESGLAVEGPLSEQLITGGRSNLTYTITDGRSRWVLRTPPRLGRTPSAHDIAREYRIAAALGPTPVPVPRALMLCEDESLIGLPFAVTGFVVGHTLQTAASLDGLDDTGLQQVVGALVEALAALHQVDHRAVGLETFGRPDGYAERQLRRWSGQWETVGIPALDSTARRLIERLSEAVPRQRSTGIVHGDYRIDNTILRLDGPAPAVAAIVDWELSTIGDPVADVAMMCAYRAPVFDLIVGEPSAWASARLPGVDELAALYEERRGMRLVDWERHLALAYFKIAVIAAGIAHRARAGGSQGRGFDTAIEAVGPYLDLARSTLGGSA